MELVKEEKDHKIFKKRSGRYAVQDAKGKFLNGADKVAILQSSGVVKKLKAAKKEAPAEAKEEAPQD